MYDIMNKTAQKMVKWQVFFLGGVKDVTRCGSVIGTLSYLANNEIFQEYQ